MLAVFADQINARHSIVHHVGLTRLGDSEEVCSVRVSVCLVCSTAIRRLLLMQRETANRKREATLCLGAFIVEYSTHVV